MTNFTVSTEDRPDPSATDGPAPHEDLTIGELLDTMRAHGEHRPSEQCFVNAKGEARWFENAEVEQFLAANGSEHPSTYLHEHGVEWETDFLALASKKQTSL